MKPITWVILGATSIIAEEFARKAANNAHPIILVGRDKVQLLIIAADLRLRYRIDCDVIQHDFSTMTETLTTELMSSTQEIALFIGYSDIIENQYLTIPTIKTLIDINVLSTIQLIHAYLNKPQNRHQLLFLSSVAACKGRTKNSVYGASKAAVEVYLQGLQQTATPSQKITIARLGFIDTTQTFGLTPFAAPPATCANACFKASNQAKRCIYFPFFWRYIMTIITHLPFFLYRRITQ